MGKDENRLNLYFLYDEADMKFALSIEKYLIPVQRKYLMHILRKNDIIAGTDKQEPVSSNMDTAHIIVVLVSADFLASDLYTNELQKAMQRYRSNEAFIIPVLIKNCYYQLCEFSKLWMLPENNVPVKNWTIASNAYTEVAMGIEKVVKFILTSDRSVLKIGNQKQTTISYNVNKNIDRIEMLILNNELNLAINELEREGMDADSEILQKLQRLIDLQADKTNHADSSMVLKVVNELRWKIIKLVYEKYGK